jgi:hypothetical protein
MGVDFIDDACFYLLVEVFYLDVKVSSLISRCSDQLFKLLEIFLSGFGALMKEGELMFSIHFLFLSLNVSSHFS